MKTIYYRRSVGTDGEDRNGLKLEEISHSFFSSFQAVLKNRKKKYYGLLSLLNFNSAGAFCERVKVLSNYLDIVTVCFKGLRHEDFAVLGQWAILQLYAL